jgi:type I restriction enzyme, S subunit
MANEDTWVALDQAADFTSGGTPSKSNPAYWGGSIPWVSAKDMKSFLIEDTEDHITEVGLENGTRLAPAGATLVLARGMTLLNDVPICVSNRNVAFNQDIKALVPRDGVDAKYLTYAVLSVKPQLLSAVDLAGHGTGRLPTDIFKSVRFRLPADTEQRAIAHILGTLDDKIEVNRRMNETLEATARAIFKSWFVEFDSVRAKASREPAESICKRLRLTPDLLALFPDKLVDSELGEIPDGWVVNSLGDLCDRVAIGPFGSDIKKDNFVESGVPVIRGGNLTDGFVDDGFVFLTEAKADDLRNANAKAGDIVITHRGTLGQIGLIPRDSRFPRYVVSQSQMVVTVSARKTTPRYVYEFLRSPTGQHAVLANTSQVGVPAIARPTTSIKAIRILSPPRTLLDAFASISQSLFDGAIHAIRQSKTLGDLRDALLRRLISGDLIVPFGVAM